MIKKTWFFEKVKYGKKLRWFWKGLAYLTIIAIIIIALIQVLSPFNQLGVPLFIQNLQQLFTFSNSDPDYPGYSLITLSWKMLLKSINYTILGTSLGFICGLIISLLTSRNFTHPLISYPAKGFCLFLRSWPILVVIYAFQSGVVKDGAAVLILFWATCWWTNKYVSDILENSTQKFYKMLLNKGYSKWSAFYRGIFLQNKNKIVMVYLYALESNLRWAALLGTVGIVGIGSLINDNLPYQFASIGIPLAFLLLAVLAFEIILFIFNNYLLNYQSKNFKKDLKKPGDVKIFNERHIIQIFLLLSLVIWNIVLLATFDWDFSHFNLTWKFISQSLSVNLEPWANSSSTINPWLMLVELFAQVIATISFAIFLSLILAVLGSEKSSNQTSSWIVRIIIVTIRIFPSFVLLYTFDPLFQNSQTTAFIILGLSTTALLTKQFSESINSINQKHLNLLKQKGYSLMQINRIFILPTIKQDVISYSLFAFENLMRTYIFYGVFSANLIGGTISNYYAKGDYRLMYSYVWPIVITLITINITFNLILRSNYVNQNHNLSIKNLFAKRFSFTHHRTTKN